ncbi:hypothetical protein [Rhodococcus aetherivorans]
MGRTGGPPAVLLTPGQDGGSPQFTAVFERLFGTAPWSWPGAYPVGAGWRTRAYSSRANRVQLLEAASERRSRSRPINSHTAAHEANDRRPSTIGYASSGTRSSGISRLEPHRAVAIRFDKLAVCRLTTVHVATINERL